ncbi:MAG: prephenate dehydrogenase/arogenate dehydrogenase family protein [Candidatus Hodarchaeota archaeon]
MLGNNLTIIGGSGGMGKVFAKYFKKHGFNITLHARNEDILKRAAYELNVNFDLSLEKSVKDADIVMVSVPITQTADLIRKVAPFLKNDSLIFDITSLKSDVVRVFEQIRREYPINCLSLHPMFGPGIKDMKNYNILLLKIGGTESYSKKVDDLLSLFKSDGIVVTETTPELHDKYIAMTLGIPHMFNILFLNLLRRINEPLSELTKYAGTTFLLQKVFAESIIQREMEMFGEIQIQNKEFQKVLDEFENLLKEYIIIIQSKDKQGFIDLFYDGLNYSREDNHFKVSYEYFYEFIKILKK